jgi:hypothetical protein
MDEAVASEIADVVLKNHHGANTSGPSFGGHPSGYVGYGADYRKAGRDFLHTVDGLGSPGTTTLQAYFDGAVVVGKGADPIVKLGRARNLRTVRLSEIAVPSP